jgi:hypothetical protein
MPITKKRKLAAAIGLAAAGLAAAILGIVAPAAHASATSAAHCDPEFNFECSVTFSAGEHLRVLHGDSPLRGCSSTSCAPIAYMPATTSLNRGGGWVTSKATQSSDGAWCSINYRGVDGWTGCWRLSS